MHNKCTISGCSGSGLFLPGARQVTPSAPGWVGMADPIIDMTRDGCLTASSRNVSYYVHVSVYYAAVLLRTGCQKGDR